MQQSKLKYLPVYENNQLIGKLYYDDLIAFLDEGGKKNNLRTHKLHFDITSAMYAIKEMKARHYHAALQDTGEKKVPAKELISIAAILILIAGLAWLFFNPSNTILTGQPNPDIAGMNKAVLTLGSGEQIVLDKSKESLVITGTNLKYNDSSLVYNKTAVDSIPSHSTHEQLTANTSRGGMYQIMLPDGTRVWLNATSMLKFPASFTGAEKRIVELTGEAYFEVAKVLLNRKGRKSKARMPFLVICKGQEVEVLGTHFNISAYPNDPDIKTTLVEGLVRVTPAKKSIQSGSPDPSLINPMDVMGPGAEVILKPNQQATVLGSTVTVKTVDAEETIAWTKGEYIFRNTTLQNIMFVVARWYDVDVIYQKDANARQAILGGNISRTAKIPDVLKSLELTANVHFKIEGRKITVMQ